MIVTLNGQKKKIGTPLSLRLFLDEAGFAGMTIAAARNGAFVPKSAYETTLLENGDDIEVVAPMQGG
jgi:sulfur carrier protein